MRFKTGLIAAAAAACVCIVAAPSTILAQAPAPAAAPAAAFPNPMVAQSPRGMAVSAQHLASDVGARILREGGNAVDAAVAMGWALAVTHPCCGNIGGGGFMMVHRPHAGPGGADIFIDFRETAPALARANMYLGPDGKPIAKASLDGWLAAGTPGSVLGLEEARRRFGTMSRERLMAPAIALARDGFVLQDGDVRVLTDGTQAFAADPTVGAIFLKDGRPFRPGERLVQADLARTLEDISRQGPKAFYEGRIPAAVEAASKAGGGVITAADFASYRLGGGTPVRCRYRGYDIVAPPPPSSGGVTLCEMLGILQPYPLAQYGFHSARSVHVIVEAMRRAYRDRNADLGDPAFVPDPTARLLSPAHIGLMRATIQPGRATPSSKLPGIPAAHENAQTTHYSVIDAQGGAVAVTYTINDDFGAKVIAPGTGFFLNDEMDDFAAKPGAPNGFGLVQGSANAIAPGKRPLSSMTPTFVYRDGKLVMVVGTPGGSRIITTVLEVILDVIDYGRTPKEAVDAPRFHNQWLPDEIGAERGALDPATTAALRRMGYKVVPMPEWGSGNAAEVIQVRAGRFIGAADRRAPAGSAATP